MNALKTKLRRLNYKVKRDFLTVENIVLMLAVVLCLVCTYQSIVSMSRNWELSEKLTAEKRELELLSIEVEAAELENEYLATNEYQELIARKNLDKEIPGEKMVVLPDNSEAAKTKHQQIKANVQEKVYSNFEKWMMYLFPSY